MSPAAALGRALRRFARDEGGANAIEFAILAVPFIMLLLFAFQFAIVAMTKMSLDTGVVRSAEDLEGRFGATTAPALPGAGTLKGNVAINSGGMVVNGSALAVEVRPFSALTSARTAITDGTTDYGAPRTVLAVRASYASTSFVPFLTPVLTVYSSALVRRQSL